MYLPAGGRRQRRPVLLLDRRRRRDIAIELIASTEAVIQHQTVLAIDMPERAQLGWRLIVRSQFLDRGTDARFGISACRCDRGKALNAALGFGFTHVGEVENEDGEGVSCQAHSPILHSHNVYYGIFLDSQKTGKILEMPGLCRL